MEHQMTPPSAPPYSSAVRVDAGESLLFVSGQLPVNPETGEIDTTDVAQQTTVAMRNALRALARDFTAVAVPTHGRYRDHPARAEDGSAYRAP